MTTRKYLASIILLAFAAMHGWACYKGYTPIISGVFSAGLVAGAAALLLRFFWARLFALGVAITGTVGCGVLLVMYTGGDKLFFYAQGVGFILLGLLLMGAKMAEQYEGQAGWTNLTIREQLLSWAVVLNVAMLPMLVKYLGSDGGWVTDTTRAGTVVTLATAAVALFLLLRRRTAGLLLLGGAGVGAMILAAGALDGLRTLLQPVQAGGELLCGTAIMYQAMQATETAMVVAGVVPGALAALLCTLAFAGPMIRLMRG